MFTRYGVYYTAEGGFAEAGAAWLGWHIADGTAVAHPEVEGPHLPELTETPRKYGFHGTIKPPFALADGTTEADLRGAFATLCDTVKPVICDGLQVARLGRFLALTPRGDTADLAALAAKAVRDLDRFRAAPSEAELAKRRQSNLTPAQEENLALYGYPYVMDQFRFHMTLTGRTRELDTVQQAAERYFAPVLPDPFRVDALTLVGEGDGGRFIEIDRRPLGR